MEWQRDTEWLGSYAEELAREERWEEAEKLYLQLLAADPENESYLMALAWVYHDSGRLDQAISCWERLLERELARRIFTGFAFDELVRLYKEFAMYDRLVTICERACRAQPDDFSLLGDLAWACFKAGEAKRAADVYHRMIAIDPEAVEPYLGLGDTLITLGEFAAAEEAYAEASRLDPIGTAAFLSRLAETYRREGFISQAEATIRRSIVLDPAEPAYWLMLGDILLEAGRTEEGITAYEHAVSVREVAASGYYFRLGNALVSYGRLEEAAQAYERAIAAEPNPFYYLQLAKTYATMGHEDLALHVLERGSLSSSAS